MSAAFLRLDAYWADKDREYNEIRDNLLRWDVTDYGMGDFLKQALA